ncbi:putative lipoprotein [Providencia alcalifaciens PAL-3]|nr:putative lipoprotein [Providencia alcalifaciens PAL-3]EUD01208.1 putative lipoprotein [Providencia alcalifaciens PAL-1]
MHFCKSTIESSDMLVTRLDIFKNLAMAGFFYACLHLM